MNTEYTEQEIKWNTKTEYVDIETGEVITKEKAIQAYVIIKKTKNVKIYKKTGTITWVNQCRTSIQLKLF